MACNARAPVLTARSAPGAAPSIALIERPIVSRRPPVPRSSAKPAPTIVLNFCTSLDAGYLPRGLAIHRSLERHADRFHLYVLCIDDAAHSYIESLGLPSATAIPLAELEAIDPELAAVRHTRSTGEYCWTAKPSLCRHLLDRVPSGEPLTYIDADMMFFADPQVLLDELGDASIMLVPHRFSPRRAHWSETDGIYNGGWITFRNDARAREALVWWRERCLEWCYDRREDGKFADQKYLDDWPERFEGVHALGNPGAGVAPWNADQYELAERGGVPLADGRPIVFYHYSSLGLLRPSPASLLLAGVSRHFHTARRPVQLVWRRDPDYRAMSRRERTILWLPHLGQLGEAIVAIRGRRPELSAYWSSVSLATEARRFAAGMARRLLPQRVRSWVRRSA
jgi:hypothetical protein